MGPEFQYVGNVLWCNGVISPQEDRGRRTRRERIAFTPLSFSTVPAPLVPVVAAACAKLRTMGLLLGTANPSSTLYCFSEKVFARIACFYVDNSMAPGRAELTAALQRRFLCDAP